MPVLPRRDRDDLAAAVAWAAGRGVVSHESALQLHGLADVNPSRIQLTVLRDNHPRAAGGEMYRTHWRQLVASDVTQAGTLPVTTVARTIRACIVIGTDPYQLRLATDQAGRDGTLRCSAAVELGASLD